ncbi:FAD binding domain-containing protein [Apiospora aurea]|uniref:FAD binding domain-containing protein n=1 Tax=Apiospora aurea TaxID=335848 RepID=A0ABR1PYC6_9PEZI
MGKDTNNIEYDIIVIGSGLAAICTALEALEHDESLSVLLIDDATAAHGADAGKHAHHDEPLGAGDLDVLISKTTNAETRAWLKQHRDAFVPEISPVPPPVVHGMAFPEKRDRCRLRGAARERQDEAGGAAAPTRVPPGLPSVAAVTGVECDVLPPICLALKRHLRMERWSPRHRRSADVLMMPAKRTLFRARLGVVLATGDPSTPSSTPAPPPSSSSSGSGNACSVSGVALARQVGGAVISYICMEKTAKPPSPPSVLPLARTHMSGIAVAHETGRRFAAEDMEGKAFSKELGRKAGGEAFLILDARQWALATKKPKPKAKERLLQKMKLGKKKTDNSSNNSSKTNKLPRDKRATRKPQKPRHQKATTLHRLAKKIGVHADGLGQAVSEYNESIRSGRTDEFGKKPEHRALALKKAPYYAVDISLPRGRSPTPRRRTRVVPFIRIDEASGLVHDEAGRHVIRGLYAAGQYTIGGSVSGGGLEGAVYPLDEKVKNEGLDDIAANVCSARRAGRHAAASKRQMTPSTAEESIVET